MRDAPEEMLFAVRDERVADGVPAERANGENGSDGLCDMRDVDFSATT
ncbi:MAG: hypothetical protein AAGF12_29260 [Myxococcota bacterium]